MISNAFLCDEMLQGLGRWLRAAGYDTLIANPGDKDKYLVQTAIDSQRYLLTRDKKMSEIKHADSVVILLQSNSIPTCIQELTERLNINWLFAPFSRCLLCNNPLEKANERARKRAPESIKAQQSVFYYCVKCDKLYWEGGHVRRMKNKLAAYHQGQW